MTYDAIVLGAGGAGLMAAALAGQGGARVLVIDHADKPGKKILISGGGRCNFTNIGCGPENFISDNPHFAKSALARYTQWDFLDLVQTHKIAWHEKTLGQLFCDGSARQIVAMLLAECSKAGVAIKTSIQIGQIRHADGLFHAAGHSARNLVIATGGPSIPKMGATGIAYDIAKQFGLNVVTPRPALVPLTLPTDQKLTEGLSGVACPSIATANGVSFPEASLFTHKGLSGPAILQISSYWADGDPIQLNILQGAFDKLKAFQSANPRAHLKAALNAHLPNRLADALAAKINHPTEMANTPDVKLEEIAHELQNLTFHPNGTEGYAKAEVTAGGIDTVALSSKTMEAKSVPGLFAIGEAVDVTGWLGGYNFQWAWSSAVACGEAIAQSRSR
ncbi:MAG: aminoacetone oxidase family FAD-binding enzyme [Pseudomonadota bacterium]